MFTRGEGTEFTADTDGRAYGERAFARSLLPPGIITAPPDADAEPEEFPEGADDFEDTEESERCNGLRTFPFIGVVAEADDAVEAPEDADAERLLEDANEDDDAEDPPLLLPRFLLRFGGGQSGHVHDLRLVPSEPWGTHFVWNLRQNAKGQARNGLRRFNVIPTSPVNEI